jgi:hypothetical protein
MDAEGLVGDDQDRGKAGLPRVYPLYAGQCRDTEEQSPSSWYLCD